MPSTITGIRLRWSRHRTDPAAGGEGANSRMNEREAEQADVRPFLPRPGEPVEEYAERLRAMHRDLSVVLQAVERGLARPHEPEPVVPVREPEQEPAPVAAPAGDPIPHGTARV